MRRFLSVLALLAGIFIMAAAVAAPPPAQNPAVHVVPVTGVISPATYDLVRREIRTAEKDGAALVVLAMDTPGGLYESTQQIVQAILDSPVPVATFVTPAGAHAASAGTYILYASHIAAMAPSTRLGAATPVQLNGSDDAKEKESTLDRKAVSDASAFIRSLAERHGRNIDWAEKAVRDAASLTATEALSQKVIDAIAETPADLARKLHGREVTLGNGRTVTLDTRDADIIARDTGWQHDLLGVITHPNIALLLMTLGTYGLIYEFASPGALFPGVIGGICLLLGLYAMNVLPISYSGLALLLLGIALMTAEGFTASFGILGIGGAAAFVFGALMLVKTDAAGFGIDLWLILTLAALSFAVLSISLGMVAKSLRQPKRTGREELLDATAVIVSWTGQKGDVRVTGEIWQARSREPFILQQGDTVRVADIDGLVLVVEPLSPQTDGVYS